MQHVYGFLRQKWRLVGGFRSSVLESCLTWFRALRLGANQRRTSPLLCRMYLQCDLQCLPGRIGMNCEQLERPTLAISGLQQVIGVCASIVCEALSHPSLVYKDQCWGETFTGHTPFKVND